MTNALPKQVQRQLAEVEEMERQMTANPEGEPPTEAVAREPEGVANATEDVPSQVTPTATAAEPAPPAKPDNEETFERRYKTLQGMFNAEVGKLQQQVKELVAQNTALNQHLAEAKAPTKQPQPKDDLVTDKDREEFGTDLLDVSRRVAESVMREHVTALQEQLAQRDQKVAQLEAQLGRTGGEVASMSFEQQLERRVPGFTKINASPEWIEWLQGVVPDTGEPRIAYAQAAFDAGDVERVARYVEAFKSSRAPQKAVEPPNASRQDELNRQVTPTRSSAPVQINQPRVYTRAEWDRQWDRAVLLARQGKSDESAVLESELTAAATQNRVR